MSMPCLETPRFAERLVELSMCLCDAVKSSCGSELCWCGVYPGGIPAWDYCGSCSDRCGMGFVTVAGASLYTTFGQPDQSVAPCDRPLQAEVLLGVLRCVPLEEDGSAVPASAMTDVALMLMADLDAIRRAVVCCFKGDAVLLGYEPLPEAGGCVGGQWRAVIGLE